MTEQEIQDALHLALQYPDEYSLEDALRGDISDVQTYEYAGIMTRDKGLVLRMRDGSEYQLTIVRSR